MLDVPQSDSSYAAIESESQARGINKELANKWKEYIHPLVNHLFKIILKNKSIKFLLNFFIKPAKQSISILFF